MRVPLADRLVATFNITRKEANLLRRIAHADNSPNILEKLVDEYCPETSKYVRSLYNSPYYSAVWRTTVALHAINVIVRGYGIEALGKVDMYRGPPYEYVNMGDTYATTLIYNSRTNNLYIGCWGTVAENMRDVDE